MRLAFDTTTRLPLHTDQVWAALTDWGRFPDWMNGIEAATGPADPGVGGHLVLSTRRGERVSEITEIDPGRAFEVRSSSGPVTAVYRYSLAAAADGSTEMRLVAHCAVRGPMSVLAPLIRRSLRRTDAGQLDALRDLLT